MPRFPCFLAFAFHVCGCALGEHVTPGGHRETAKPSGFLSATAAADLRDELHQAIRDALGNSKDLRTSQRFQVTRDSLKPLWMSLAKNSDGRVDRRSLRYAVHRHILKTRHISVLGLEPFQQGEGTAESALLSDHAPSYVRAILARSDEDARAGFSLDDAVAMVSMMEELVVHQGHEILKKLYQAKGLDTAHSVERDMVFDMMDRYLIRWMMSNDYATINVLEENSTLLDEAFDDWSALQHYVRGIVHAFEYEGFHTPGIPSRKAGQWDPLGRRFSFEDAQMMTGRMAMSFGSFWHGECVRVKSSLQRLDYSSTGRVALSDFHGAALAGEWRFSESKDYLNKLGALDDTSATLGPRVIIPNYLQGASNCIITDKHFRVCCSNDCEPILAEIEAAVQAPVATPAQLIDIIGNMTRGLNDEETSVSPALRAQLEQVADHHHGHIPLHGRLFAQFLHYVFPQDCPFPHKAGTVSSMSPLEYGDDYMASEREIERHASLEQINVDGAANASVAFGDAAVGQDSVWMTQWSHEEELLTEHIHLHAPWERQAMPHASLLSALVFSGVVVAAIVFKGARPIPSASSSDKSTVPAAEWAWKAHLV